MTVTNAILRHARGLVAAGWCQHHGKILKPTGPALFCATGAIIEAVERADDLGGLEPYEAVDIAQLALSRRASLSYPIAVWNDAPGRTQAEVVAAFDRALGDNVEYALRHARKLVAEGWVQGSSFAPAVPGRDDKLLYCASGAIIEGAHAAGGSVSFSTWTEREARRKLLEANQISGKITDWNDAPGRTQAEVVAAFDKALA